MRKGLYYFLLIQCLFIAGCRNGNSIAERLYSKCGDKQACRMRLKDVTDFKWDRVYVFPVGASLEEIDQALGFHYNQWKDIGEKIIFVSKGQVVYHEDYFPYPEMKNGALRFELSNSLYIGLYNDAVFSVEKQETEGGKFFYLVTPN
jgi:hypothetical protein